MPQAEGNLAQSTELYELQEYKRTAAQTLETLQAQVEQLQRDLLQANNKPDPLPIEIPCCDACRKIGVKPLYLRAVELERRHKTDEAIHMFKRVLSADPTHKQANRRVGCLLSDRGDMNQAEKFFAMSESKPKTALQTPEMMELTNELEAQEIEIKLVLDENKQLRQTNSELETECTTLRKEVRNASEASELNQEVVALREQVAVLSTAATELEAFREDNSSLIKAQSKSRETATEARRKAAEMEAKAEAAYAVSTNMEQEVRSVREFSAGGFLRRHFCFRIEAERIRALRSWRGNINAAWHADRVGLSQELFKHKIRELAFKTMRCTLIPRGNDQVTVDALWTWRARTCQFVLRQREFFLGSVDDAEAKSDHVESRSRGAGVRRLKAQLRRALMGSAAHGVCQWRHALKRSQLTEKSTHLGLQQVATVLYRVLRDKEFSCLRSWEAEWRKDLHRMEMVALVVHQTDLQSRLRTSSLLKLISRSEQKWRDMVRAATYGWRVSAVSALGEEYIQTVASTTPSQTLEPGEGPSNIEALEPSQAAELPQDVEQGASIVVGEEASQPQALEPSQVASNMVSEEEVANRIAVTRMAQQQKFELQTQQLRAEIEQLTTENESLMEMLAATSDPTE